MLRRKTVLGQTVEDLPKIKERERERPYTKQLKTKNFNTLRSNPASQGRLLKTFEETRYLITPAI